MYELVIKTKFSAAHQLKHYKGKCDQLHGHNWYVKVILEKDSLDKIGLVIDFREAKKIINNAMTYLDHKHLNNLKEFRKENPSTENIARFLYKKLSPRFDKKNVKIKSVGVWESPESGAYYYEEK